MFDIKDKFVTVKTPIIETCGWVKAYNPGSILLQINAGEDKEGGDISGLQQIISPDMVVTLIED